MTAAARLDLARNGVVITTGTPAGTVTFLAQRGIAGRRLITLARLEQVSLDWQGHQYAGALVLQLSQGHWQLSSWTGLLDEAGTAPERPAYLALYKVLVPALREALAGPGVECQLRMAQAHVTREQARDRVTACQQRLDEARKLLADADAEFAKAASDLEQDPAEGNGSGTTGKDEK